MWRAYRAEKPHDDGIMVADIVLDEYLGAETWDAAAVDRYPI